MHIETIINPTSGSGMDPTVAKRRVQFVEEQLARRGLHGSIHLTERGGHARELAEAAVAAAAELVIVWGGDGTLNEVGSAAAGSDTPLGIIPAGSGNGFAAALGISRDPSAALEVALGPITRAVDVGVIGERRFLNVAGIGADARIAERFNRRARGSRGKWPYISIGLAEACRYRAQDYTVRLGDQWVQRRALMIAFANGREYGMGAILAPGAALDDGVLEAFVIEDRSVAARFWHARHLVSGSVDRAPRVLTTGVTHARIESSEPILFHVDGEPAIARTPLDVAVLPRALRVKSAT